MDATRRHTLSGAALLLLGLSAQSPGCCSASFYERGAEGWFWYIDPRGQDPVPAAPPIVPEPAPTQEQARQAHAAPEQIPAPGPPPLSTRWFRENLETYRDRAIDDPTPENVAAYYYLQRVALDKSSRFAKVAERVVQGDPLLDEITQRPTSTFGANLVNKAAAEQRDLLLRRIAGRAALWFFFRSDCPYCEAQAPLLERLSQMYGFDLLAVSVDGPPLRSGLFANSVADTGQAAALGVRSTPAMFLTAPATGQMVPLAQGLLSLAQLQERAIDGAARAGWIREEEAASTKAVVTEQALNSSDLTGPLPSEASALVDRLRALAQ